MQTSGQSVGAVFVFSDGTPVVPPPRQLVGPGSTPSGQADRSGRGADPSGPTGHSSSPGRRSDRHGRARRRCGSSRRRMTTLGEDALLWAGRQCRRPREHHSQRGPGCVGRPAWREHYRLLGPRGPTVVPPTPYPTDAPRTAGRPHSPSRARAPHGPRGRGADASSLLPRQGGRPHADRMEDPDPDSGGPRLPARPLSLGTTPGPSMTRRLEEP